MHQAALSAMGHEIYSYAVGIDENGVVHKYVTGDLKPEVRAKMEAKVKADFLPVKDHLKQHLIYC